jgi:hypothetical protein
MTLHTRHQTKFIMRSKCIGCTKHSYHKPRDYVNTISYSASPHNWIWVIHTLVDIKKLFPIFAKFGFGPDRMRKLSTPLSPLTWGVIARRGWWLPLISQGLGYWMIKFVYVGSCLNRYSEGAYAWLTLHTTLKISSLIYVFFLLLAPSKGGANLTRGILSSPGKLVHFFENWVMALFPFFILDLFFLHIQPLWTECGRLVGKNQTKTLFFNIGNPNFWYSCVSTLQFRSINSHAFGWNIEIYSRF